MISHVPVLYGRSMAMLPWVKPRWASFDLKRHASFIRCFLFSFQVAISTRLSIGICKVRPCTCLKKDVIMTLLSAAVDRCIGGMRGITCLVSETSLLERCLAVMYSRWVDFRIESSSTLIHCNFCNLMLPKAKTRQLGPGLFQTNRGFFWICRQQFTIHQKVSMSGTQLYTTSIEVHWQQCWTIRFSTTKGTQTQHAEHVSPLNKITKPLFELDIVWVGNLILFRIQWRESATAGARCRSEMIHWRKLIHWVVYVEIYSLFATAYELAYCMHIFHGID